MSGSNSDYTQTPNLGLFKPNFNMAVGTWGDLWNANADALDSAIHFSSGGGPFLPLAGGNINGNLTITGRLSIANLPTSPTGLNKGDVWISGGFLCAVP